MAAFLDQQPRHLRIAADGRLTRVDVNILLRSPCTPPRPSSKQEFPMPAYVILINNKTTNATELDRYRPKAVAARATHPVTFLAVNGKYEVLEGAPAESVTIAQFPDMAAAKAWYDSPEYQDAKQHRLSGADFRIILTEGL
jgi:uncharacterized protein (DUF1330 family)